MENHFNGKIHQKWPFSIDMFDYQRKHPVTVTHFSYLLVLTGCVGVQVAPPTNYILLGIIPNSSASSAPLCTVFFRCGSALKIGAEPSNLGSCCFVGPAGLSMIAKAINIINCSRSVLVRHIGPSRPVPAAPLALPQ